MAISITSSRVKITDNVYTFADIYQYAVDNNKTSYVKNLGTSYELKNDLIIESGAVEDSEVHVTILGDLIQVYKGAYLKLGIKRSNGSTYGSCTLKAPNIKIAYGFGHTSINSSGDLFLYNSTIDVFGFWGFFEGTNHVEVIDCFVNGFGRIAGTNSILKNIIFKQSHGKYGILSPKGELRTMQNLSVFDSKVDGSFKCSVYHNPEFANNLTIIGGIYDGYNKLAYIESNAGGDTLKFIDSEIRGNYEFERESNNVDVFIQYTFNPICRASDGSRLAGVRIIARDKNGDIAFDETTNQYGSIDQKVTYYKSLRNGINETLAPYTMTITKDNLSMTRSFQMDKALIDIPLFISNDVSSEGNCDDAAILARITEAQDAISAKLTNIDSGIRQVIANVVDEVNENQTLIQETGFTITI